MEGSSSTAHVPLLSRFPLGLVLVLSAVNLIEWLCDHSAGPGRLLVALGFLLCAPHMYYSPHGFLSVTAPAAKAPGWAVVAIVAGLVMVVAGFVIRQL